MSKILNKISLLLGVIIYISLLWGNNLWMDEAFSACLVRNTTFNEMLTKSAADTLPPLYNIINWCLISMLGFNPWVLRLSSIIPMLLCLVISYHLISKRFGDCASTLFCLCLSGMPALLYYGCEIRMYALGFFFVTVAGLFAIEIYYNNTIANWIIFSLCTLGSGYTHHFAFVAAGFLWLYLLIYSLLKNKIMLKSWLISLFTVIIGYLPCLFTTIKQMGRVNGYFTMPELSLHMFIQCIKLPFTTNFTPLSILLIAVYFITLGIYIINIYKQKSSIIPVLGLTTFLGIIAFGFLATKIFTANIFTDRYIFPSLGLLWLGFILAITSMPLLSKKPTLIFYTILLFSVVTIMYIEQFSSEYNPGASQMISYFDENLSADDGYVIFEDNYQIELCFRYYFPDFKKYDVENISDIKGNAWYIMVPGFEDKLSEIEGTGLTPKHCTHMSFDRYDFDLYKIN